MTGSRDEETLGVFEDRAKAEQAAERARRAGVDESRIHVGESGDAARSLNAEMQEEMGNSWVSPQAAAAYPKEAAKGFSLGVAGFTLVGMLVALPFAFIPLGDLSLVARLVIAAAVGAAAGGTVGLVVGPGLGARGPDEPLAAERGVTVRVEEDDRQVVDAMRSEDPIRVDLTEAEGGGAEAVSTDEEGVAEDVADTLRHPGGDWSHATGRGSPGRRSS